MRIILLIAVSALVAGCSGGTDDDAKSGSTLTRTSSSAPSGITPPAQGATIAEVVAWIEAGTPADPGGYHTMTLDGVSTEAGDRIAFTTPGTESNCTTNRYRDGALACLVKLADPPPRPPNFPTAWKNNWVDFDGARVDIGSPHGDPGPFIDGSGAELPAGQSLAFGDYRCRVDAASLFCVDYAHQTAIRLSAAGIQPFGCLRKVTPPADIGMRFSC